jgi:hypothetical protein
MFIPRVWLGIWAVCAKAFPDKEAFWQKQIEGLAKYRERLKEDSTIQTAIIPSSPVEQKITLPAGRWFPVEPKRTDPKYQAWINPIGQEYGYELDRLRWEETVKQIKAQIEAERLIPPKKQFQERQGNVAEERRKPDAANKQEAAPPPDNVKWDEWLALQERLKGIHNGSPQEVTIQEVNKSASATSASSKIPAHEGRNFVGQQILRADKLSKTWARDIADLKSTDKYVRKMAAAALGSSKSQLAVKPLITCLIDSDWGVRFRAARSLGEIGSIEAVGALIKMLKDEEASVRREAAEALGKIMDVRAMDALHLALHDRVEYVRNAAAAALERITGRTFSPVIQQNAQHPVVQANPQQFKFAPKTFALDMEKVRAITNETKEVSGILADLMEDDPKQTVEIPKCVSGPVSGIPNFTDAAKASLQPTLFDGLEDAFKPILKRLLTRDSWPLADFKAIADEFRFMPGKIHSAVNEWSFEALGDNILDGDGPVTVRLDLIPDDKRDELL